MRRLHIDEVTGEMRLAKSIYHNGKLILAEGADNLEKYKDALLNCGIFSVYVEDEFSEHIEINDVITEETRNKCKKVLNNCFKSLKQEGKINLDKLNETVAKIIDELFTNKDVMLSMEDIGAKDDVTMIHSVSTAVYAILIGKSLGYDENRLRKLAEGALFHDVGKVLIDESILMKKGRLTEEEYEEIKKHPVLGYNIIKDRTEMSDESKSIVLLHHERLDGSGYPFGLKSNEITESAKIVSVADVYDALTAERCYRKSFSNFNAYKIMKFDEGVKYDERIFKALFQNVAIYPNGIVVNLSDGTHGIVKEQNPKFPFRPLIRVIDDRDKSNLRVYDLDLANEFGIDILDC